jgi:hypothetical protein
MLQRTRVKSTVYNLMISEHEMPGPVCEIDSKMEYENAAEEEAETYIPSDA